MDQIEYIIKSILYTGQTYLVICGIKSYMVELTLDQ